jgi:hypothetical protein
MLALVCCLHGELADESTSHAAATLDAFYSLSPDLTLAQFHPQPSSSIMSAPPVAADTPASSGKASANIDAVKVTPALLSLLGSHAPEPFVKPRKIDDSHPLASYWISSSHNTYIDHNQSVSWCSTRDT